MILKTREDLRLHVTAVIAVHQQRLAGLFVLLHQTLVHPLAVLVPRSGCHDQIFLCEHDQQSVLEVEQLPRVHKAVRVQLPCGRPHSPAVGEQGDPVDHEKKELVGSVQPQMGEGPHTLEEGGVCRGGGGDFHVKELDVPWHQLNQLTNFGQLCDEADRVHQSDRVDFVPVSLPETGTQRGTVRVSNHIISDTGLALGSFRCPPHVPPLLLFPASHEFGDRTSVRSPVRGVCGCGCTLNQGSHQSIGRSLHVSLKQSLTELPNRLGPPTRDGIPPGLHSHRSDLQSLSRLSAF
mmetsp:Transcript_53986/g.105561  ORF Transcript_53986/g.105561 Transcript_53986/m.105561 type:complete len:293 (-) Transcript_53986:1122-2000(-)